MAVNTVTVTQD